METLECGMNLPASGRCRRMQSGKEQPPRSGIDVASDCSDFNALPRSRLRNCRNQALSQLCAFSSPKTGSISAMAELDQRPQGQRTEYTDRILYGPGSQPLNAPFLIFLSASSKEANKQCGFVGSSSAIELHDSGECSGAFRA